MKQLASSQLLPLVAAFNLVPLLLPSNNLIFIFILLAANLLPVSLAEPLLTSLF